LDTHQISNTVNKKSGHKHTDVLRTKSETSLKLATLPDSI